MQKYLYLTQRKWATSWVSGGEVPLSLASSYRRAERSGIYTPDEARIDKSSMDLGKLAPAVVFEGNVRNGHIGQVVLNGVVLGENISIDRYEDDGLILCLCNRKSKRIADRLGKFACVCILDVERLASVISEQLGVVAISGNCEYTSGHERDHFLKSNADRWQDEFRLYWRFPKATSVHIPSGLARRIKL